MKRLREGPRAPAPSMVPATGLGPAAGPVDRSVRSPVAADGTKTPSGVRMVDDNGVNSRGESGPEHLVPGRMNRGQYLNHRYWKRH